MERLRSIKISVEVDTNKITYEKEFSDVDEMLEWLDMLELGICPTSRAVDPQLAEPIADDNQNSAGN